MCRGSGSLEQGAGTKGQEPGTQDQNNVKQLVNGGHGEVAKKQRPGVREAWAKVKNQEGQRPRI